MLFEAATRQLAKYCKRNYEVLDIQMLDAYGPARSAKLLLHYRTEGKGLHIVNS